MNLFSDTSTESVLSDDYAIPPDAYTDSYSVDSVEQPRASIVSDTLKKVCHFPLFLSAFIS